MPGLTGGNWKQSGFWSRPSEWSSLSGNRRNGRLQGLKSDSCHRASSRPNVTHICARARSGRFWVRRITIAKRMRAKLAEVKNPAQAPHA